MKKIFNKLLNYKLYIITFLVALITISIVFILKGITPFGNKSLLCVDFFHQYSPMFGELHDRIFSGKNFIYSFNLGLGIPFFRNFLNYLSSPFNIIILFFSHKNLLTSYSFIIGLKAVFSACTMVYFLSHKFKTKDLILIPLGIMYAFSAYYIAYYWNIMWLDGMVFLPLITLGIEYIINEHKWKFYTIWLAIMLLANYFIGYMICIFCVIYFICYCIYKLGKQSLKIYIKQLLIFAGASILAGMIVAVFLIPLFLSLKSISATGDYFPTFQYYKFTISDFLKYHLTGVSSTVFASDPVNAPNISAGILSVALFFPFIFNKAISTKTKICYLVILCFFILAFFSVPIDYILQAFHVPNDLPYRYSFLYTFVLVIISAYSILNIKKVPLKYLLIEYIILIILLLILMTNNWDGINNIMIIINIILLSLYLIIYIIYSKKQNLKMILTFILTTSVSFSAIITINKNWTIEHEIKDFKNNYNEIISLINYIKHLDNNVFYRIEKTPAMTFNDPSWYNYYGITTFSSMAYESMARLQYNLGIPGNLINSYYYKSNTPIYNLMFNINYIIGNNNDKKNYITIKDGNNPISMFKYNIGLGYGINNSLKKWNYIGINPFVVQNDFIEKATNISNILQKIDFDNQYVIYEDDNEKIIKYTYFNMNENDTNLYLYANSSFIINYFAINNNLYYCHNQYSSEETISDEIPFNIMESYEEPYIININNQNTPIEIYISLSKFYPEEEINTDNILYIYTFDNNKFIDAFNILKQNRLKIIKFDENYIEASINIGKDMFVYTSIPYDEGWNVYVDNIKVETFKLGDSLLAFNADEGNHKIVFKYIPKGFKIGLLLTITSIGILIIFTIKDKKNKRQS